jgi:hypothetical protein
MKLFKTLVTLLASLLLLAGCGGGSTLSGPPQTGGGTTTVAAIAVAASPATVAQDGSSSSAITATAVNSSNVAVAGVVVTFQVTAGGVLTVTQGTTDSSGIAKATLSASPGTSATSLTVTASSAAVSGTATVSVVTLQQTLTLSTNAPQVPSDSSKSATISALLRDTTNNVLPGVQVRFSPDSGAITPVQTAVGAAATTPVPAGTTDSNGVASATLNAGNDFTNRTITVTVTAGTAPAATLKILVTGTALTVTGQQNLVTGTQTPFTALLIDSSGQGIAAKVVTFGSSNGNTLSATTATTDFSGHASVNLTAVNPGSDTVTATALGLTATTTTNVSGQSFTITAPVSGSTVPLNTFAPVTVAWTSNGAAVANQPVSFSTTRGTIVDATTHVALSPATVNTDANGHANVAVMSTLAGPAIIAASGTSVTAQVPITFTATTPSQVSVQSNPATVAIGGQSTISAVVRDAQNNLVQGASVDFQLVNDSTGAALSTSTAVTNSQGTAQVIFTASSTPSSGTGITISAVVHGTAISGSTKVTVGGQTVSLTLGTGNTIGTPSSAQYSEVWAVQAVDSHGGAVPNQPITAQVLPLYYYKGFRFWATSVWATVNSIPNCPGNQRCTDPTIYPPANYVYVPNGTQCANEDVGWTGIYVQSQDLNQNGIIDPGNVATVAPSTGGVTDANGSLLLTVTWPRDHAYYVGVRLLVKASVAGTESTTSADFLLPGLASDFNQQNVAAPGLYSPYGFYNSLVNDCSNPN